MLVVVEYFSSPENRTMLMTVILEVSADIERLDGECLHDADTEHDHQVDLLLQLELETPEHWNWKPEDP